VEKFEHFDGRGLQKAGESLTQFIDEHALLDSDKGPRRPLVIIAFDEADTLTDNPQEQEDWNLFTELRRVLRQIKHLQIFSLFISTAGRFDKISHPPYAISEISFDDLAHPALKDTVTMQKVVEIDWIVHLGRPLYVHPSFF
jgi:hypothetical protein